MASTTYSEATALCIRSMDLMTEGTREDFEPVYHPEAVNREAAVEPPIPSPVGPVPSPVGPVPSPVGPVPSPVGLAQPRRTGPAPDALDPGFHGVRTHWIRGSMAFQLAQRM